MDDEQKTEPQEPTPVSPDTQPAPEVNTSETSTNESPAPDTVITAQAPTQPDTPITDVEPVHPTIPAELSSGKKRLLKSRKMWLALLLLVIIIIVVIVY